MDDLHAARGDACLQDQPDQGLRHAVAMPLDLDVVINVHAHGLVGGEFPGLQRQGLQCWRIQLCKRAGSAARQPLECLVVELFQQRRDGLVDIVHARKALVAQSHQDPALDNLHSRFDLGLVLRVIGARRQHRGAVVASEVLHRLVGARFIAVGVGNQGFGVVRHDELGHPTDECQGAGAAIKPVGHGLARCGTSKGVARSAQSGHEDVGTAAVHQLDRGTCKVDEQLLACAVGLAHRALECLGVAAVVLAELRVGVRMTVQVLLGVLLPQQHERHALAAQFFVNLGVVGVHEVLRPWWRCQQAMLQSGLVQGLDGVPIQTCDRGQTDVLGNHAFGDAQGGGDTLVREPSIEFETQNVLDLAHVNPWCRHAGSSKKLGRLTALGETTCATPSRWHTTPCWHRDR